MRSLPLLGILLLTALTTTTIATPRVLALPAFSMLLLTITTLGGATTPLLVPILRFAVLTPTALRRSATTTTSVAVIASIPIPPFCLGTRAGRPHTGPQARLGPLQSEH